MFKMTFYNPHDLLFTQTDMNAAARVFMKRTGMFQALYA